MSGRPAGSVSLSETLRSEASEVWEACYAHPFVQSIGRGDLPDDAFRRFLVQDYLFLIDYSRVLAFGAAKARDLDGQRWFSRLLTATLDTEMELHRDVCAQWGIRPAELEEAQPLPTTVAYTSFLVATAASGGIGELAASLLPCQWGYADIGVRLKAAGLPDHERYASWIESYADPAYLELTDWLRGSVDEFGRAADARTLRRWRDIFVTTLRYELAFWEMSWSGEEWPGSAP